MDSNKSADMEKLNEACRAATQAADRLRSDMDQFERIFTDDRECWRGEAASEEQSFVTSDRQFLEELLRDMKTLIDDAGTAEK